MKNRSSMIIPGLGLMVGAILLVTSLTGVFAQNQPSDIPSIVSRVNPAVVSIVATVNQRVLDPFTGRVGTESQSVAGTGFLVNQSGLIVTNTHVITAADSGAYKVFTTDGKQYDIQIVDQDPTIDVAIIKINGTGFPFLTFANSDSVRLGETAIAIGNALGEFRNTVSVGVVSGLSRSITATGVAGQVEQLDQLLQTDAAINPGNSGGPLLNSAGNVIGVNVAAVQGSANIGFAIPSNVASQAVNSVLETGKIVKPFLGVRYVQLSPIIQQTYNLPSSYGAWVHGGGTADAPAIQSGSPAEKAGLMENDIIITVDNVSLQDQPLGSILRTKKPGDRISITIIRKGRQLNIQATLGSA